MVANPKQKSAQVAPYVQPTPHAAHGLAFPLQVGAIHPALQSLIKHLLSHAIEHESLQLLPLQVLQESYDAAKNIVGEFIPYYKYNY